MHDSTVIWTQALWLLGWGWSRRQRSVYIISDVSLFRTVLHSLSKKSHFSIFLWNVKHLRGLYARPTFNTTVAQHCVTAAVPSLPSLPLGEERKKNRTPFPTSHVRINLLSSPNGPRATKACQDWGFTSRKDKKAEKKNPYPSQEGVAQSQSCSDVDAKAEKKRGGTARFSRH